MSENKKSGASSSPDEETVSSDVTVHASKSKKINRVTKSASVLVTNDPPGTSGTSGTRCGNSRCRALVGNVNAIRCDFCKLWYHLSCTELDEESYRFLSNTNFTSIVWKCATCPSLEHILENDVACKLSKFEQSITRKIDCIETNISKKINLAYKARGESVLPEQVSNSLPESSPVNPTVDFTTVEEETLSNREIPPENNSPLVHISNNADTNSTRQVCGHYRKGVCRHGASGRKLVNNVSCKFLHPQKCRKYCKFGRDGCEGNCGMLHPILCKNAVRSGECLDENCKLAHLLGTQRYPRRYNGRANKAYWNEETRAPRYAYNRGRVYPNQGSQEATPQQTGYFGNVESNQWPRISDYCNESSRLRNTKDSMHEIASTIKQVQSCVNFLMQNTQPRKPEYNYNNTSIQQPLNQYSNGYNENIRGQLNQHHPVAFPHRQEAKNYNL